VAQKESGGGVKWFLLAIVSLFHILESRMRRPAVAAVSSPKPAPVLKKVVFDAGMSDDVVVCVALSPALQNQYRILGSMVCGETVGSLRYRLLTSWSAN
jgi:hypothetical protein